MENKLSHHTAQSHYRTKWKTIIRHAINMKWLLSTFMIINHLKKKKKKKDACHKCLCWASVTNGALSNHLEMQLDYISKKRHCKWRHCRRQCNFFQVSKVPLTQAFPRLMYTVQNCPIGHCQYLKLQQINTDAKYQLQKYSPQHWTMPQPLSIVLDRSLDSVDFWWIQVRRWSNCSVALSTMVGGISFNVI